MTLYRLYRIRNSRKFATPVEDQSESVEPKHIHIIRIYSPMLVPRSKTFFRKHRGEMLIEHRSTTIDIIL